MKLFTIIITIFLLSSCTSNNNRQVVNGYYIPTISGGWVDGETVTIYSDSLGTNNNLHIYSTLGRDSWQRIDLKYSNSNRLIQVKRLTVRFSYQEDSNPEPVKETLTLTLNKQGEPSRVNYRRNNNPQSWPYQKLQFYRDLLSSLLNQGSKLQNQGKKLWLGYLNLTKKQFYPCGQNVNLPIKLTTQQSASLQEWQRRNNNNSLVNHFWVSFLAPNVLNSRKQHIIIPEQLFIAFPASASNCALLDPLDKL